MSRIEDAVREDFRTLVEAAVREGLDRLRTLIDSGNYIGSHYDWYTVSWRNGMPSFIKALLGPKNYSEAFMRPQAPIPADSLTSFSSVLSFVRAHPALQSRIAPLIPGNVEEQVPDESLRIFVFLFLGDIIDRYLHLNRSCDFLESSFRSIYEPLENYLFSSYFPVEYYIPILFVHFDFAEEEIVPGIFIRRMDEDFHLARASITNYGSGVHDSVLPAATHALALENYQIIPQDQSGRSILQACSGPSTPMLKLIDSFFAALRIVTGLDTGYAQFLIRPLGWTNSYKAYLPPLKGTSIRAYPDRFDNFYWLEPAPEINSSQVKRIGTTFAKLQQSEEKSIHLAVRRLNFCYLRQNDEDIVLDATIGLEALLSDDQPQEMTHKLAMRMAALYRLLPERSKTAADVFGEIKKIYSYRSAIVHGSTAAERKKEIKTSDGKTALAPQLALEYLRLALQALLSHPGYCDPVRIDRELLLQDPPALIAAPQGNL